MTHYAASVSSNCYHHSPAYDLPMNSALPVPHQFRLLQIFMLLGCPTPRIWPDVTKMPLIATGKINLRREQERFPFNNLNTTLPSISPCGYELFELMLAYDQKKRITARSALRHAYFYSSPYPKEQDFMPTYPTQVWIVTVLGYVPIAALCG